MIGVSARQDSLWSALIGLWRRRELIWFLTLDIFGLPVKMQSLDNLK